MKLKLLLALWFLMISPGHSHATETPLVYELVLENHVFNPDRLKVPAGKAFELHVKNKDDSFEEFESKKLVIEKFIGRKKNLVLKLGPLKPGEYDFFGEFHMKTAHGVLIAE